MSLVEFIFGKSDYTKAREQAERFYLAGKLTEEEYWEVIKKIDYKEWFNSF